VTDTRDDRAAGLVVQNLVRVALVAVVVLLGACLDRGIPCGDGYCVNGLECDAVHGRCITADQWTSCAGKAERDVCDAVGVDDGVCRDGVCLLVVCGDGVAEGGEACDGDDLGAHVDCTTLGKDYHPGGILTCSRTCAHDESACGPRCGDGVVQARYEQCDGDDIGGATCGSLGMWGSDLACDDACQFDTSACSGRCGDDERNGPEVCDGSLLGGLGCTSFGWYGGELACDATCLAVDKTACTGFCGDGVINGGELCDGVDHDGETCISVGASAGALGCSASCQPTFDTCFWGRGRVFAVGVARGTGTIWGSSPTDIWASSRGHGLFHFDGTAWRTRGPADEPGINRVWGAADGTVWAAADHGQLFRFHAGAWETIETGLRQGIVDLWARGRDDVRILQAGRIRHYQDGAWTDVVAGMDARAIRGLGPDIWVVGRSGGGGARRRFDGAAWGPVELVAGTLGLDSVWGSGADDVWTNGGRPSETGLWHFDGRAWTLIDTPGDEAIVGGWSVAPDDMWGVGVSGVVMHYDGRGWTEVESGTGETLLDVWAGPDGVAWAVGATAGIIRIDGVGWQRGATGHTYAAAMWVGGPGDVWATGQRGTLLHFDGRTWIPHPVGHLYDATIWELLDLWGSGPDDVWAVGENGIVLHFDGIAWSRIETDSDDRLMQVWGSGRSDVWIAASGSILRCDGEACRTVRTLAWSPMDMHGSAPGDIWIAGSIALHHFDGTTWTDHPLEVETMNAIWSSSPDNVWAVGEDGIALHFDGAAWQPVTLPTFNILNAIWGSGPDDIWAAGEDGAMIHYDGGSWSRAEMRSFERLTDVRGSSADDVWALDSGGGTYHLDRRLPRPYVEGVCEAPAALYCNATVQGALGNGEVPARPACPSRFAAGRARPYRLHVPVTGQVVVELEVSRGDLDLVALAADEGGGCAPEACLAASQAPAGGEQVALDTVQGQSLYVVVEGSADAAATYTLRVTCDKRE
jgi:hypothetical protein